jgi:phenylacetate-CoA ligase
MDQLTQKFLETLLRTQFLTLDRMLLYQRGLIERLVRHARATVPFYRDSGRLNVLFTSDDQIDWERWNEVPVLTREQAQQNADALYAETVPPECGDVLSGYTAGSSGTPLAYRTNQILAAAGSATLERGFVWAGLPPELTLALFRNDRLGEASYPNGISYHSVIRGAPRMMHHLAVQTPVEDQGRWLDRIRPDVVMNYPGALAVLAQDLPDELQTHTFRLAVCVGEVTTEQDRAIIERGFRCPVLDLYSGSEFGTVAVEDCNDGLLYVCEETMFVEFSKPGDFALADPDLVEVIFTPFYNFAMPLIRYATGDFATIDASAAADERTLRRLKRVAGRERNIFILPSGRRWWPTYQNKVLCDSIDYRQIQFAQTARDRIEIRFVSDLTDPIRNLDGLMAYLRAATPEPMDIAVVRVADIARRASGKYEYATREIATPAV